MERLLGLLVAFLPLRRRLSRLFRLSPSLLQCHGLLFGRSGAGYDLLETRVHRLIEVSRGEYVDVVAEGFRLRRLREVVENLLEQLGDVEPSRVHGVGGDRVELFDDQASGVALLQVIDKLDRPFGITRVRSHEQTRSQPGRRRDAGAIYGREREEIDFEILGGLDDLRHEPRAGGQHGAASPE